MPAHGRHNSGGDKENDTASRIKHATGQGFAHTIPSKHVFGTPEEIAHRVGGTFSSLPDNHPTDFKQLGPKSGGSNVNDHRPATHEGTQKWANPRKYA
jgi:hypothetical protein